MEGKSQEKRLPWWASVAFVARCARRYADAFAADRAEPAAARTAVLQAVQLAEIRADRGGDHEADSEALELQGQFFDHYDIESVLNALDSYGVAAGNTFEELGEDPGARPTLLLTLTALRLASLALQAAFAQELEVSDLPLQETIDWAVRGAEELAPIVEAELATLEERSRREGWTDETGVPAAVFGPLWPNGTPPGWPKPRLTFRPRARIIRTIGDRLISGPEAAVIELVKNSYDADASKVRVTFFPPLRPGEGEILFEDDGHGMTLEDIQEKWMEPATSDKKQRKESPRGRKLLGSKGIGRFAAARLGRYLELTSTARRLSHADSSALERTRIPDLDWDLFERTRYLDEIAFDVENALVEGPTGTVLRISGLRDEWNEAAVVRLHHELRRLVSPITNGETDAFSIVLDLSRCTKENSEFDGQTVANMAGGTGDSQGNATANRYEIRPFPVLEACDYAVDGIFDESGRFDGAMTIRRAGQDPEPIHLTVPLREGEDPCGIVVVRLNIFDREATSIRSTAEKAGFGHLGVREARKLLDSIAGVAIYREGFRVRPYGDAENDWLTLDAKRVQNPSLKIGRNQVAGIVLVDEEDGSHLVERSSREGLEENGSFRRLQSLLLALLAEAVEPRRRRFRISAGLETRKQSGFREVLGQAELLWAERLLEKVPEGERAEARKLITRESERLTGYLKDLEARQAQLEAQVTLGLIIGEVMHQGNTPLAFIETEVARLLKWWPTLFDDTPEAEEDRAEIPKILNGMNGSAASLRILFHALSPLAGSRRGEPQVYSVDKVIDETLYLFKTKADAIGLHFKVGSEISGVDVRGYPADLATALTNLIDNAMYWLQHHGVAAPSITLTAAETRGQSVTLFVQDNGAGVPEEFRDDLFDVGFTLKPNGTGLGLSIAREAIFRSGGELHLADSQVGARFAITLPVGKQE